MSTTATIVIRPLLLLQFTSAQINAGRDKSISETTRTYYVHLVSSRFLGIHNNCIKGDVYLFLMDCVYHVNTIILVKFI